MDFLGGQTKDDENDVFILSGEELAAIKECCDNLIQKSTELKQVIENIKQPKKMEEPDL